MKHYITGLLILLPCLLQAQAGNVYGIVIDANTSMPLHLAHVALAGNGHFVERTDMAGNFSFQDIPEGCYRLEVGEIDHWQKQMSATVTAGKSLYLTVSLRPHPPIRPRKPHMTVVPTYPVEKKSGWRRTLHRKSAVMNLYGIGP